MRTQLLCAIAALCVQAPALAAPPVQLDWTLLTHAHSPAARAAMVMAYDPATKTVLMFGGYGAAYYNDTWRFDGATWTKLSPATAPSARAGAAIAFDAPSGKLILFGGYDGSTWLGDSWAWDGASGIWTKLTSAHSPGAATGAAMFTDPTTGHAMLYGGYNPTLFRGDFSLQLLKWTGTDWKTVPGTVPTARAFANVAADPIAKTALIVGGEGNVRPSGTWTWDGASWTDDAPPTQPPLSASAGAAYDPALDMIVTFGGFTGIDQAAAWGWSQTGKTWTRLTQPTHPQGRESPGMCYDPAIGKIVLFGGVKLANGGKIFGKTWVSP